MHPSARPARSGRTCAARARSSRPAHSARTPAANRSGCSRAAHGNSKCPSASPVRTTAARKLQGPHPVRLPPALRPAATRPGRRIRHAHVQVDSLRDAIRRRELPAVLLIGRCRECAGISSSAGATLGAMRRFTSLVRSQNTPSGKVFSITSRTQCCASTGGHLPDRRAGREHFDQREAQTVHLVLHRPLNGPRGLRDLLVVAEADALDVDRRLRAWPAIRSRAADSLR